MTQAILDSVLAKLQQQLSVIYQDIDGVIDYDSIVKQLVELMRLDQHIFLAVPHQNHWSEQDIVLITYGDSVMSEQQTPLQTLASFIGQHMSDVISCVHILPFFPYSSDDGFAVIDYASVNEALGDWHDIQQIASKRRLMADLVINHCSSRSLWFDNFLKSEGQGYNYFFTASPDDDLAPVIRPRTSPLLRKVNTALGEQYVWCTFSHDQVDFDFRNPEVLLRFVEIIRLYLDMGVRIFRMDAVAFLWKVPGTTSINLPQTHEIIRLMRTLIEHACPDAMIITETNIPNTQNLTYFGNANEAHAIYNFSLPPLLVNTLITGNCLYLKRWLMSMPPSQDGTCYFNFIASHDGIGLRPAEGLLSEQEITTLLDTMKAFGGRISWRSDENSQQKAYEINIALYDALQGTVKGKDNWALARYLCAHAIMLALEGIPGIYIHSMLGTRNDYDKLAHTHHNRAINRHRWQAQMLRQQLSDPANDHSQVLVSMKQLIAIRQQQAAFHPNATQFTLHLGLSLFGFWRQSRDRKQSIFCIFNITDSPQRLSLTELNLVTSEQWSDLITNTAINELTDELVLSPYQSLWITNKTQT